MKEVIDDLFTTEYGEPTEETEAETAEGVTSEEQEVDVDTADLLKLYLREASRAPMLDARGEIQSAKRIERARNRLQQFLSRSPLATDYFAHLRNAFRNGDESARDWIQAG